MQQLEPGWHMKIQSGIELVERQESMTWKESADSFCNLPLYEQGVYCRELKRRSDIVAKQMEEQEALQAKPKSVSGKVIEWHQKQLKIK